MTNTQPTDESAFGMSLNALGGHLIKHPGLPEIYSVQHSLDGYDLHFRIYRDTTPAALAEWAATLANVESYARRINDEQIDGHVIGDIGNYRVDIIGGLPPDAFSPEKDKYEWDVTVLLQEA